MCRYGQQRFLAFMRETHAIPGPGLMTVHEQLQSPGMLRVGCTMSGGLMGSGSACCGLAMGHLRLVRVRRAGASLRSLLIERGEIGERFGTSLRIRGALR